MADFTSGFWNVYITVLTLISIAGCALLLWTQSRHRATQSVSASGQLAADSTGHVWDEDLTELNTPMPRWWMWLFYITIVFALGYLFLYPGLGTYPGKLGWKSSTAYKEELVKAEADYKKSAYARMDPSMKLGFVLNEKLPEAEARLAKEPTDGDARGTLDVPGGRCSV